MRTNKNTGSESKEKDCNEKEIFKENDIGKRFILSKSRCEITIC